MRTRASRIKKFVREAASPSAVPGLVIAAMARDSPLGRDGFWDLVVGDKFSIVEVRTRATGGEPALIDAHDLGELISCEEVLIDRAYDFNLVPFTPELIVDCGAHNGLFSLVAGLRYSLARLLTYEPEGHNFRAASAQLSRFNERARLVEAAVHTTNGYAWFYGAESNTGHLTAQPHDSMQRVRVVDLREEAPHWDGKRLLLKMDIEGAETEVLPHVIDSLPMQCAIFFEVHGGQRILDELLTIASRWGFNTRTTRRRGMFIDAFAVRV